LRIAQASKNLPPKTLEMPIPPTILPFATETRLGRDFGGYGWAREEADDFA
jgi:hypothetical protein